MDAASTTKLIELKQNAGNAPTSLDPLQQFLAPHVDTLIAFWFSVWVITAIVLLVKLWYEYKNRNRKE